MQKNKIKILELPSEIEKQFVENSMKVPYLFTKIEATGRNSDVSKPVIKTASCEKYNTTEYQCVTFYKPIVKF